MKIVKFLAWIKDSFQFCKGYYIETHDALFIWFPLEINAINPILYGLLGSVSAEGNKNAHLPIILPNSVAGHDLAVNRVADVIIVAHAK